VAKVYSSADIENTIEALGKQPVSGLIVAPDTFSEINGTSIVSLAAQHRVPAVYAISLFARAGGLMSYGPNTPTPYGRRPSYVESHPAREKAADLPVQAPVKFDLIVNLKAAKMLGLVIPESFLLRADEVIE